MRLLLIGTFTMLFSTIVMAEPRLVLVAGGGTKTGYVPAKEAKLSAPFSIQFDSAGLLYFAEYTGHTVRKIDAKGNVSLVAGTGEKGFALETGPGEKAELDSPHCISMGRGSDLFICDSYNKRIRKVDLKTGDISTFAGTGQKGFTGDGGPASKATMGDIYCTAFDPKFEHLYFVDLDNRRVRVIDMKSGIVTTIAGNGNKGVPEDGADALAAPLIDPRAVAADANGNVYVLERAGHALRVVDKSGKIRTVAGTGKAGGVTDETDPLKATFDGPKHLSIDAENNVLIADTENHVIRRYLPKTNKLELVAGTGTKGAAGLDGPPLKAQLNKPHGVWPGPDGSIYIADSENNRIVKIAF